MAGEGKLRPHARPALPFARRAVTYSPHFQAHIARSGASARPIRVCPKGSRKRMNGRQFVYFMKGLTKAYPGNRKVLENIHLQFYPDAKIGVLGVNGSGKSTLLRIMAGIDNEYTGEAWVAQGARVGYLPQEPRTRSGQERCARTSWKASPSRRRSSTATTNSR